MTFVLEILIALLCMSCLISFVAIFSFTWSWAQQQKQVVEMREILGIAATEWAAVLVCFLLQLAPLKSFFEAPPLANMSASPQQIPVIFVPSLHTRAGIFFPFYWRLKGLFFNSLWFFDWHFFLKDPSLMEDELSQFIDDVLLKTQAQRFRLVSFGSSRPIVSKVLQNPKRLSYCEQWIAISSPTRLGGFQKMLLSRRMKNAYEDFQNANQKTCDLSFHGQRDLFFSEESLSDLSQQARGFTTGHFGCLFEVEMIDEVERKLSLDSDHVKRTETIQI